MRFNFLKFLFFRFKDWLCHMLWKTGEIYYIGGSDTFPSPLNAEEEALMVSELGGENDLHAKSVLIERNLRLVVYIARKFENTGINIEDLISIGTIGLIKAINTFKPEKKIKLATYASRCIENEILMLIRTNKKHKNNLSLSDPVGTDKDGNELTLMDLLFEKEDCVFDKVERSVQREKLLRQIKLILSEREYTVVCLRYALKGGVPLPQREVAKMMKISRSYISRIEKRAIEKLRTRLHPEDFFE